MRRRSASPEAETMSHWPPPPPFIRLTISSEEPAGCRLSLHPVALWKGSAQDLSAYPSHSTRLSAPSVWPTEACGLIVAVGGCARFEPLGVLLLPQAPVATATTARAQMKRNLIDFQPPPVCRAQRCAPVSRPVSPDGPQTFWHRPGRPYSDVPPRAARRGRDGRHTGWTCPRR